MLRWHLRIVTCVYRSMRLRGRWIVSIWSIWRLKLLRKLRDRWRKITLNRCSCFSIRILSKMHYCCWLTYRCASNSGPRPSKCVISWWQCPNWLTKMATLHPCTWFRHTSRLRSSSRLWKSQSIVGWSSAKRVFPSDVAIVLVTSSLIVAASESHFDSMSPDNITRYNIAVLHIKSGNLPQANNVIQQMMADMGITINSYNARIPVPVLNLQIYMHIRTENIEGALQLIKRRRILVSPGMNNNKALLKITKWLFIVLQFTIISF